MIAYRAELWCDGCSAHYAKGIPHDDLAALSQLGRNLEEIARRDGWAKDGAAHFCLMCQTARSKVEGIGPTEATPERVEGDARSSKNL